MSPLILLVSAFAWHIGADPADDELSGRLDRMAGERATSRVIVRFEPGELTKADMEEFAALADRAVHDVAAFTGIAEPRQRVRIYVSSDVDISHTYPGPEPRMFVSSKRVAEHSAPYLHEMVHVVAGKGGAMWLEEGFASYVASEVVQRYGGYYAPVLSDDNDAVDGQARHAMAWPDAARELAWIRGGAEPAFANQGQRARFYILAHSFTKFLARHLGLPRLVALHRANDRAALRRDAGQWQRQWLATLAARSSQFIPSAARDLRRYSR